MNSNGRVIDSIVKKKERERKKVPRWQRGMERRRDESGNEKRTKREEKLGGRERLGV